MSDQNQLRAIVIAAALLLSYGYFFQNGGWDQNSRFDLTRAMVEQHTLRIDAYHQNTGDKAFFNGHYYSEKAPGLSLTAVPAWLVVHEGVVLSGLGGRDSAEGRLILPKIYFSTLAAVALPTSLAGACIFLLALRFGSSLTGAAFGAVTFGLGTPIWCYATLFWDHATVAALLLFAFAAGLTVEHFHSPQHDMLLGAAVGLASGWATVTEYQAAPAAAILGLLAMVEVWPAGRARIVRVAMGVTAGALVCAAVLLWYNKAAFGAPFRFGFSYYLPPPNGRVNPLSNGMGEGLFGVTYPRFWILRQVLVGHYRGLILLAPVLALTPIGFVQLWRRKPELRASISAAAAIAVYYVLLNASFRNWDGGDSYGPRQLSPALPFLCLALGVLWTSGRRVHRAALVVLGLYGIALTLIAVSTDAMPQMEMWSPVQGFLWPAFRSGHLAVRPGTFNLGQCAGLQGLASLLPLLLIWLIALASWVRLGRFPMVQKRRICSSSP